MRRLRLGERRLESEHRGEVRIQGKQRGDFLVAEKRAEEGMIEGGNGHRVLVGDGGFTGLELRFVAGETPAPRPEFKAGCRSSGRRQRPERSASAPHASSVEKRRGERAYSAAASGLC